MKQQPIRAGIGAGVLENGFRSHSFVPENPLVRGQQRGSVDAVSLFGGVARMRERGMICKARISRSLTTKWSTHGY